MCASCMQSLFCNGFGSRLRTKLRLSMASRNHFALVGGLLVCLSSFPHVVWHSLQVRKSGLLACLFFCSHAACTAVACLHGDCNSRAVRVSCQLSNQSCLLRTCFISVTSSVSGQEHGRSCALAFASSVRKWQEPRETHGVAASPAVWSGVDAVAAVFSSTTQPGLWAAPDCYAHM
jgi:hypothetical protein